METYWTIEEKVAGNWLAICGDYRDEDRAHLDLYEYREIRGRTVRLVKHTREVVR
jgi:hypothetical protein